MEEEKNEQNGQYSFLSIGSLKTFSDAIFAFAITLLAINIRVPEIGESISSIELRSELVALIPKFIGFFLTFMIGCLYWISYHRVLHYIKKIDGTFLFLNIFFLMFVVLLPFPNDLLGRYQNIAINATIESFTLAIMGIAPALMWLYASCRHKLIDKDLSKNTIKKLTLRLIIVPAIFTISIPLTFVLPFYYITFIWMSVIAVSMISQRIFTKITKD